MAALLCALVPCWAMAQAADDEFGSAWILEKLARPAPVRTSFVEVRNSRMLKTPLRVTGEYLRPDAETLVREVHAPYVETTTLRDGEATIARAGRSPRTFALSRAPELAALQASFGALLDGDHDALERHYDIEMRGVRERWTMTLTPKDTALAAEIRDVTLYGRGAELRCIETRPREGELQRTLLAGAARSVDTQSDAAALQALCRGGEPG
ncbi:LolA-related protein [Luteimonas suaedae]|uniref:LolA-related protein n=1 Tax=Luteimonas suaedae TaxID=2605430 RepID=UPI0011EFCDC1|nr:LolA-related protein [Luteimonas suaedae]